MNAINNHSSETEALKVVCVLCNTTDSDLAGTMFKKGCPFTECTVSHLRVVSHMRKYENSDAVDWSLSVLKLKLVLICANMWMNWSKPEFL